MSRPLVASVCAAALAVALPARAEDPPVFKVGGFVQSQLVMQYFDDASSPNAKDGVLPDGFGPQTLGVKTDGTTTNQTFFRVRRARIKVEATPAPYARFVYEIDPFPVGGQTSEAGTMARNVEAIGVVSLGDLGKLEIGAGIFKVPFGYEVLQSDADRPFIERSGGVQNMVPAEFDLGARAMATLFDKRLVVQLGLVNGQTEGEKAFVRLPDLNAHKDLAGRARWDFGPFELGLSGYVGRGIVLDATTQRFAGFPKRAVDFEAALHHKLAPSLGETRVFAELILGKNMDHGLRYAFAFPVLPTGKGEVADLSQRSAFVRVEQDLGRRFALGLRWDRYTPDTTQDANARTALGAVFVVRFGRALSFATEYTHVADDVHKPGASAANKKTHVMSYLLQARF